MALTLTFTSTQIFTSNFDLVINFDLDFHCVIDPDLDINFTFT
jgi:hypothetical protein